MDRAEKYGDLPKLYEIIWGGVKTYYYQFYVMG
jgi:hypothetical protein